MSSSDKDTSSFAKEIAEHCRNFMGADTKRGLFQIVTTLALFIASVCLMLYSLQITYWLTGLLVLPTAGLLVRLFVFQHDCGHQSFFKSKKANTWTGRFLSLLTVTPYDYWRRAHNMHHATSGDLDRRSIGGIDTVTLQEYKSLSKWHRFTYRLYRNPFVLLILGTPFYVLVLQRIPLRHTTSFHENYKTLSVSSTVKSILLTNLFLVAFYGTLAAIVGPAELLMVYLPILIVTCWIGGWLFFIQHQFEDTYWEKHDNWNGQEAALHGSSYYEMPKILQWFTGNIGMHHIHHLCSQIPNYKLQACMDARPELAEINKLTLRGSLECIRFKLWDEDKGQLVTIGGKSR